MEVVRDLNVVVAPSGMVYLVLAIQVFFGDAFEVRAEWVISVGGGYCFIFRLQGLNWGVFHFFVYVNRRSHVAEWEAVFVFYVTLTDDGRVA